MEGLAVSCNLTLMRLRYGLLSAFAFWLVHTKSSCSGCRILDIELAWSDLVAVVNGETEPGAIRGIPLDGS